MLSTLTLSDISILPEYRNDLDINSSGNPGFTIKLIPVPVNKSVSPTIKTAMSLSWEVPDNWNVVGFNVYKSQTENSEYEVLTPSYISNNFFIDNTFSDFTKSIAYYYRIEAVLADGRKIISPPKLPIQTPRTFIDIKVKDITRREWWLLSKITGQRTLVFKKKLDGKKCHECFEMEFGKIKKDFCKTCFGTGIEGGYIGPIDTYIQYEAQSDALQKTTEGTSKLNTNQCWTINIPKIVPDDLMIRVTDRALFRVDAISNTEIVGKTVRQILTINQLSRDVVENLLMERFVDE